MTLIIIFIFLRFSLFPFSEGVTILITNKICIDAMLNVLECTLTVNSLYCTVILLMCTNGFSSFYPYLLSSSYSPVLNSAETININGLLAFLGQDFDAQLVQIYAPRPGLVAPLPGNVPSQVGSGGGSMFLAICFIL